MGLIILNIVPKRFLEKKHPYLIKHLDITGEDVLRFGFEGEEIGLALGYLLLAVIFNQDLNKREILLGLIKNISRKEEII